MTSGSGAVADIRLFGAVGDGVTDDTVAIQAAIDQAAAAGGGLVFVPAGNFLTGTLRLKSKAGLVGTGIGSKLKAKSGQTTPVVALDDVNVEKTRLEAVLLDGTLTSGADAHGLSLDNTGGSGFSFYDSMHIVRDVFVNSPAGRGVYVSNGVREAHLDNVVVNNAGREGFFVQATDSSFLRCISGASGRWGFYADGANNRYMSCKAFGSGDDALFDFDGWYLREQRSSLTACDAQDNARHGFLVFADCELTSLAACVADSNNSSGFRFDACVDVTGYGLLALDRGGLRQNYGYEFVNSPAGLHLVGKASGNTSGPQVGTAVESSITIT